MIFGVKDGNLIVGNNPKKIVQEEIDYLNKIVVMFPGKGFSIEKNSNDYTTLKYKLYDLVRVKIGTNNQWLSCFMVDKDIKAKYINNPMFELQKNKNQLHWKSKLSNVEDYKEIIEKHIEFIDKN